MPGYIATSTSSLAVAQGALSLQTQSALAYLAGERVSLAYVSNPMINMQGTILLYNPVTGSMTLNVDTISGIFSLQPVFNTQPWGETNVFFSPWNISLLGNPAVSNTQAVVPTITVRQLDPNWDPMRGAGAINYLSDTNAVAQITASRLKFLQQEWFENIVDGTPLFQNLLGQGITMPALELILRQRILGTPYVTGINFFSLSYVPRSFNFNASVQSAFGEFTVSNQPPSQT